MIGLKAPPITITEPMRKAIFLDRDGVLNVDHGYVHKVADLQIIPGVGPALVELKHRGFLLIVVSNQSGVGRGYFTATDVDLFHAAMQSKLQGEYNVQIDAFYVCYDTPETQSFNRKPAPGMVLSASKDFQINLQLSWLVGDRDTDIECANAAGVRSIHITNGMAHKNANAHAVSLFEALAFLV